MAYSDQNFEDELRDKLSNDAPLPPGMDWEAMRKGINQKVGAKRKSKRPFLAWWWLGIGVVLLLLAGILGHQFRSVSTPPQQTPLAAEAAPADQPTMPTRSPADATGFSSKGGHSDRATPPSANGLPWQADIPSTAPGGQSKIDKSGYPNLQIGVVKAPKDVSDVGAAPQASPVARSGSFNEKAQVPTVMYPRVEALAILPFLSYSFIAEGDFLPSLKVNGGAIENGEKQEDNEGDAPDSLIGPKGWSIDILAGTQFAGSTYRGDDAAYAALRSKTETALPGHHIAVGLGKSVGEKWQFRTGLAYDRIRTRTDYDGMRTFDSTFQDVPLRIGLNSDTIFGSALLQVRESREVKSFQREQRLTLPLLIGRNFRLGRNRLAMRAGPEFGLLIGSGGKILTANEGVRSLSDADFQPLSISARLEGELAIPLGPKGPLLIGRVGFRRILNGGPAEIRRTRNSVIGGVGLRMPL